MKILFVHNEYANFGGEDFASQALSDLLIKNNHTVEWYKRSSSELQDIRFGKIKALFTSIYNKRSNQEIKKALDKFEPDVVQVQNLYPLISPSILRVIKEKSYPIVMRCPNYRLFCPNSLFLDRKGKICEKCTTNLKEFWCIAKNCENDFLKSAGYALRNGASRISGSITRYVDKYIVQSEFQLKKFEELGIPQDKIAIVPGLTPTIEYTTNNISSNGSVSFIGRIDRSKGIDEFVEAARALPHIQFEVTGKINEYAKNLQKKAPSNVQWNGFLIGADLDKVFSESQILVVPSKWYEGFPNVITRGMTHGKPIITTDIGAMSSIIDHMKTGYLIKPSSSKSLVQAIEKLYSDDMLMKELAQNARKRALNYYSDEKIYEKLMKIYSSLS